MYNIANILTIGRIALIPVIVALMLIYPTSEPARMCAFVLYSVCGISDFFDGWLARKYNLDTNLGRMLDPIADKLLITVILMALVALQEIQDMHIIAVMVILSREMFISGLREFLADKKVKMPVTHLAKWKTTFQILALGFFVIGPASVWVHAGIPSHAIGITCLWFAAILTFYTGFIYFKSSLSYINQ